MSAANAPDSRALREAIDRVRPDAGAPVVITPPDSSRDPGVTTANGVSVAGVAAVRDIRWVTSTPRAIK